MPHGGNDMIIEKRIKNPELWVFVKNNLPPSLAAYVQSDGYGFVYGVVVKENREIGFFKRDDRPILATVDDYTITVNHPNYLSDFEDIARKYESKYQHEIKLRFWEEP
jgi:hypothetical protein